MHLFSIFLLLSFMFFSPADGFAKSYKWIDANGGVHWSDEPPAPDMKVKEITILNSIEDKEYEQQTQHNEVQKQEKEVVKRKTFQPRPQPDRTRSKGLPAFTDELKGRNPVRIRNPNHFSVAAGIRSGHRGKDLDIPAKGVGTVYVPNGRYDIFFVYSDKPDALFQGDSFSLKHNGVEIQIVMIVDGNYGIRQVK